MPRANLFIKAGSYTGDGADGRAVTGLGFNPQLVIVKGGANVAVIRTKYMTIDSCGVLAGANANAADLIQELINDGFVVGTDAKVNTNATVYYYIAIGGLSGQNYFKTGKYVGNAADDRDYTGVGFQADFIGVKSNAGANAVFRTSQAAGDLTQFFNSLAETTNIIQAISATGFQVGTANESNASANNFHWFALKALAGAIKVGSYIGNGLDDRNITGIGFNPDIVIVKAAATTQQARIRTNILTGDSTLFVSGTAAGTNAIQSLITDGFQIGSHATVNTSGDKYYYLALKSGNFNAPITRTQV